MNRLDHSSLRTFPNVNAFRRTSFWSLPFDKKCQDFNIIFKTRITFEKTERANVRTVFCTCPDLGCVPVFISTLAQISYTPVPWFYTPLCHDRLSPTDFRRRHLHLAVSRVSPIWWESGTMFKSVARCTPAGHHQLHHQLHQWSPVLAANDQNTTFPPTICLQGHYFNTLCQFRFHRIHCSWV